MSEFPKKLRERCDNTSIVVVTGHYGSGKTEFSINLAMDAAEVGKNTALIDIDIVNPYFRSREKRTEMEDKGIRVIATSQAATDADVPSLPPDIYAAFDSEGLFTVFDVGGDPAGARVLGRYHENFERVPYEFFVVVNKNRPMTATPEKAVEYIDMIERTCRLKATGIVGNTHLCGSTDIDALLEGIKYTEKVSELSGLDVICHTAERKLAKELDREDVLPIDIFMKKPWE